LLDPAAALPLSYALFQLVAHPNTPSSLANGVLGMLVRVLDAIPVGGAHDTDLEMHMVAESLYRMGAKRAIIPSDMQEAADLDSVRSTSTAGKATFTNQARTLATSRLLRVVNVLARTG
jgi:hypothetical protein